MRISERSDGPHHRAQTPRNHLHPPRDNFCKEAHLLITAFNETGRFSGIPPSLTVDVTSLFSCRFLLSPVGGSFSAAHFPGHCFWPIPAPGSFAASAFPVPPERHRSLPQSTLSLWEQRPLASECPRKMGQEKGDSK